MTTTTEWSTPQAPKLTTWTNPTALPIWLEVDVPLNPPRQMSTVNDLGERKTWTVDFEKRRITWAPGETKAIPSVFDRAVHIVTQCGHPECRKGICRNPADAGPRAVCGGGLAPLLQREGQRYGIDVSLVARAEPVRSMAIAPGEVAGRLGAAPDPALDRARARARAKGAQ